MLLRRRLWRAGAYALHVPEFFFELEIANILWKKLRRAEISRSDAGVILTQIRVLPLSRHAESPLLTAAFDLAERTQRTVYDCLYLALAMQTSGHMVTADQRLFNAVSTTPYAPFICWVGNAPPGP